MEPLTALDWQEVFLAGASAIAFPHQPAGGALAVALEAMAAKAREIAERQRAREQ